MAGKKAKTDGYMELGLATICPNPWNPRKRFSGKAFDELVESIRQKGVLEPILVRPLPDHSRLVDQEGWPNNGKIVDYQVVAGERRFRASYQLASENGGPESSTIPAIVRSLSDDEAFDIMTIENLQREDLTELEEARNFQIYLDRHGTESLPELAQRTSISASYIRRRVRVLALPKKVQQAWEAGDLKYGHMEQLCRLKGARKIQAMAKETLKGDPWGPDKGKCWTVKELKRKIDSEAPRLDEDVFDLQAAGCLTCVQNSDMQKRLFAIDQDPEAKCSNPQCFRKKLEAYLKSHWAESGIRKRCKTNGYRWRNGLDYNDYDVLYQGSQFPKCRRCHHKVTLVNDDGSLAQARVCMDPACHTALERAKRGQVNGQPADPDNTPSGGPRVAWHGSHFRDIFFKEQIGSVHAEITEDVEGRAHPRILRMLLFGLLTHTNELDKWFAARHGLINEDETGYFCLDHKDSLGVILDMIEDDLWADLADAALYLVLDNYVGHTSRRTLGTYLGIDLAKEWRFTKEYLKKKTISEMLEFGNGLGIFEDPAALEFLSGKLKRKTFASCRKPELVKVFLESGAGLSGKVPAEIMEG